MPVFSIKNIPGHDNAVANQFLDLTDLNSYLLRISDGTIIGSEWNGISPAQRSLFVPGFTDINAKDHFRSENVYTDFSGNNILSTLNFNGVNQALVFNPPGVGGGTDERNIPYSTNCSMSFWIRINSVPDNIRTKALPIATVISDRWQSDVSLLSPSLGTSGSMHEFDNPVSEMVATTTATGFSFGFSNQSSVGFPRYYFNFAFGPFIGISPVPFDLGIWYYVSIVKQNLSITIHINGQQFNAIGITEGHACLDSPPGALIVGATVSENYNVPYYMDGALADLSFWCGPSNDYKFNKTRYNLNPKQFFVKVPDDSNYYDFLESCKNEELINCITNFYRFSPPIEVNQSIEPDAFGERYNAQIHGRSGKSALMADSDLGLDVLELDGVDDYVEVPNLGLTRVGSNLKYLGGLQGSRKDLLFDFQSGYTVQFWMKPDKNYLQAIERSKTYVILDEVGSVFKYAFGMPILSSGCYGVNDFVDIQPGNLVFPSQKTGLGVNLGYTGAGNSWYMFNFFSYPRNDNSNSQVIYTLSTLSNPPGDPWPWLHVAFVVDFLQRKLYTYITEHGDLTPTAGAVVTNPVEEYEFTGPLEATGGIDNVDSGQYVNPNDAGDLTFDSSRLLIGARFYYDLNKMVDFFKGRITDFRVTKTALPLEIIDRDRYKYL